MAKIKKSTGIIIAVVIILLIVIGVFAWLNRSSLGDMGDGTSVSIEIGGKVVATDTIDDLKNMKNVSTIHKTIKSSSKKDETGDFTGVSVLDVLLAADPSCLDNATAVIASSGDGYSTSYSVDEILEKQNVMLIFQQDGTDLVPYSDGGSGPLRIVVMDDEFGNRSAMWLTKLTVK